ncbi:MAG: hypothetical protein E7448_08770 [Ruminococcaceae bacterium]|nr:hypothetical protein [Oscillospiraceae bacterium]
MWLICMLLSIGSVGLVALGVAAVNKNRGTKKQKISLFHTLFMGVFVAALIMFLPIHKAAAESTWLGYWRTLLLSAFNAMQVFTIGCEYSVIKEGIEHCPDWLSSGYQVWASTILVVAPIFTFGFVLSLFKNLSAYWELALAHFKDLYIFSELNEKSLALAGNLKADKNRAKKIAVVFTDVFDNEDESTAELLETAKKLGAICFDKDVATVNFKKHSKKKNLRFFAMGNDETENLNKSLKLIEQYKDRENTNLYVFSTKVESELLLTAVDKGSLRVRRINEVRSLVNRMLHEQGHLLFEKARETADGTKQISAVVVGMGNHGTEMVKALTWYCQMDGYSIQINAFDQDPLAEDKFRALAPELMSPEYNGVVIPGEAQYQITVHSDMDVDTATFADAISKIKNATYVLVALGNDDVNINTAVKLRMYFERLRIHPVIQAIVYNSQQKKALEGIKNYRGQDYDIQFIGDIEEAFTEAVIMGSELEEDALRSHMKWGSEEEFWAYEYNYRSSIASAIHRVARVQCHIPGAGKREAELTVEERDIIEDLEHRRWNAYMRAEGYIYSGSKDKSSRNDLAKMHNDLVDFGSLSDEIKRIDSRIGAN